MIGKIHSICLSEEKGAVKRPVAAARLIAGFGLDGDAHGGDWHRQVSLLADEDASEMREKGAMVGPGDFGENILTTGLVLHELPIGTVIQIGQATLEVTQIGKECHTRCAIYDRAGTCIMPLRGIFAIVRQSGDIAPGMVIDCPPS